MDPFDWDGHTLDQEGVDVIRLGRGEGEQGADIVFAHVGGGELTIGEDNSCPKL